MSEYIKDLLRRSKYGSEEAQTLLGDYDAHSISTGLRGFNDEDICFYETGAISNLIARIEDTKPVGDIKKSILIDSYNSATIEGAVTTVDAVVKAMHKPESLCSKDEKMVINSIKAVNEAFRLGSITQGNVRGLWEILTQDICENKNCDGVLYRSKMVYIGSLDRIEFTPCPVNKIQGMMDQYYSYSNANKILQAVLLHWFFVYIHPFCDGNGRMARLLQHVQLCNYSDRFKCVSVSDKINENLAEYYKSISDGEYVYHGKLFITKFIEYMLECILEACIDRQKGSKLSAFLNDAKGDL